MYDKAIRDIILRNESGVDLRVEGYYKKKRYDNITIKNNSEVVNHVEYLYADANKYSTLNIFAAEPFGGQRDSIAIIFEEKKVIIQSCPTKDFVAYCNLEKDLDVIAREPNKLYPTKRNAIKKANISKFKMTLTKADYDRAKPI